MEWPLHRKISHIRNGIESLHTQLWTGNIANDYNGADNNNPKKYIIYERLVF
jgi:hypothetical protein